jgi:HEAT repeat protein
VERSPGVATKRIDTRLLALQRALRDPTAPKARARIVEALESKSGLLVAAAVPAAVGGDEDAPVVDEGLLARLPAAFERLMHDAGERDPQCRGKTAIAKALRRAEADAEAVFLAGARHVQHEPVWGGKVDTAAELRGICLMALVESHHPRAMVEAAHLLADAQAAARMAAARALGCSGRDEVAEPLLRLRVETEEDDAEVLGECFGALLQVAPGPSLDYVAGFLGGPDDAKAEAAALALGGCRLPRALAPLLEQAQSFMGRGRRRVALLAIALLRVEEGWAYLVELIEQGPPAAAAEAIEALSAFAHDDKLRQRVRAAVERRGEPALRRRFEERFEG